MNGGKNSRSTEKINVIFILIRVKGRNYKVSVVQGVEQGNLTLSCSGEGGDPAATILWKVPETLSPYTLYEMEGTSILTGKHLAH